jgi:hypothetical protein
MIRGCFVVFALFGLLLTIGSASAADDAAKEGSRSLLREGNERLKKDQFDQALTKFEQAYALYPSPKLLFGKGQALRGLKRHVEAVAAFEQFLSEANDVSADFQEDARKQIAELTALVARLQIHSNRDGATVRVDGKAAGTTPLAKPILVEPGRRTIEVEWQKETRTTTLIAAAGEIPVELKFEDVAAAPVVARPDLVAAPESAAPAASPAWYRSTWVWVAGSVLVAGVATTLIVMKLGGDRYPSASMGTQRIGN